MTPRPLGAERRVAHALGVAVGKESVVSLVITRIQGALLRKELRPRAYLPSASALTRTLGVNKPSVREAVKMLQAMGVVEVRRGQGTVVREHPGADSISPLVFQFIMGGGYPDDLIDLRVDVRTGVLGHGDGAGDGRGP